jgi:hypothetical protein
MVFELLCYLWLMTVDFKNFGQRFFFEFMSNIFFEDNFKYFEINCQMLIWMGVTRRCVLLN